VAALYLAAAPQSYIGGLLDLLPTKQRTPTRRVLNHVGQTLWGWLVGQFIDMLVVGALCGVGLSLLGMPLAFILALIAGLLNFVPYIGAIAGAIPAVLIALSVSTEEALFVGLLYFGVQTFEGNVTAPLIQKRTIDLPPALTILSQTAFGVIFGLFGVILATPFAAALLAAIHEIQAERTGSED
jgi:predicted PurR-regulated permease PerM